MAERSESVVNRRPAPARDWRVARRLRCCPQVVHAALLGPVPRVADSSVYPQTDDNTDVDTLADVF